MNTEQIIDELIILSGQMFVEIDAAKLEFDKLIVEAEAMLDRVQNMQVKIEDRILEFKKMIEDENERQAG
jgi:hypothetical protein